MAHLTSPYGKVSLSKVLDFIYFGSGAVHLFYALLIITTIILNMHN